MFIQITGDKGDTGEKRLESSGNNFERGQKDNFTLEALDLGEITKVRVGHGT